jgi:hypothetical protein
MFLDLFQDAEQRAGTVLAGGDRLVRKLLIVERGLWLGQLGFHENGPPFAVFFTA